MNLLGIMLMAGQNGQNSGISGIMMMILIIVIFYFFMIRPQTKRQKEEKKFREMLEKGQKVMTLGGIHAKVKEVKESTVMIEVAHDVVIEVEKSAIAMTAAPANTKKEDKPAKKE